LFAASDARLVLAVGNDSQWKAACSALSLDDLRQDESLSTNAGRLAQRDRVVGAIAGRLSTNVAAFWLGALQRAGVPCGVVRSVQEALKDVSASPLTGVAPAVPGSVRLRPPKLDEHGNAIRRQDWSVFQAS
jgi:crotonobetainyl-CoA:carnitine CoA-transferase CaiB-like acyl-CoA transferase